MKDLAVANEKCAHFVTRVRCGHQEKWHDYEDHSAKEYRALCVRPDRFIGLDIVKVIGVLGRFQILDFAPSVSLDQALFDL